MNRIVCKSLVILSLLGLVGITRGVLAGELENLKARVDVKGGTIKGGLKILGRHVPVVVYVEGDFKNVPPPKEHAIIDQKNMVFIPHVLPIRVGTTVDFPNSDSVRHSIFSKGGDYNFDLGQYPVGEIRSVTFDKPGEVPLLCSIHTEMSAYVVVLDTPYFTTTVPVGGAPGGGTFTIEGVPPGKYMVKTWSELYKPASEEVTVKEGNEVFVSFALNKRK